MRIKFQSELSEIIFGVVLVKFEILDLQPIIIIFLYSERVDLIKLEQAKCATFLSELIVSKNYQMNFYTVQFVQGIRYGK